jgi:2-methylisocitrate lyase-like PEP mutase family enzyme
MPMHASAPKPTLRALLNGTSTTLVPGVGDALGALLVAEAGFPCVYMSGYYACATLGYFDAGLVSSTEMINQAARICAAVDLPVIADADTGYGNAVNVIRTVREYEQVGVAGIHIEDQALPKKCGAVENLPLVSTAEMCRKIEAAVDARRSDEFQIIARSDALGSLGIDEAIRRGNEYRRAGADAFKIMGARSIDDMKRFRDGVEGPLVCTVGSWGFKVTAEQLKEMGYQIALFTVSMLRRNIVTARALLMELKQNGFIDHGAPDMLSMNDMHNLLGMQQIKEWERRYAVDE